MRKIRVAGSMLIVAALMSGAAAMETAADELTAESYPVKIVGKGDPETAAPVLQTTGSSITFGAAQYFATSASSSTTLTVVPSYSGALAFGFPGTVDMNGCYYLFHINGGSSTEGNMDIICPFTNEMTVTASLAGTTKCVIHIASQVNLTGAFKYVNLGSGATREITIDADVTGIDYRHTGAGATGIAACTSGSGSEGRLTFKALFTATKDGQPEHQGLFLSST